MKKIECFSFHINRQPVENLTEMFDNYMLVIAASGDGWPDARKRALGTEGQRLFYTLPNTGDTFAAAVTALKEHFVPKVNVVAERHKFRQRAQRPDETVNQFLASLRELAAACEFGNMEEQMLRDQLIERVANTRIRDRLLLEPDLTLAKAMTLALQIESGLRDANIVSDATAAGTSAPVRTIQKQSKPSRCWDTKKKPPDHAPPLLKLPVIIVPASIVDLPTILLTNLPIIHFIYGRLSGHSRSPYR
uniref:Retrotransposon gag domain-containing protein n=1 Tax=Amphilophus citrinellus TaxID=61819 RepID=A0A3Q0QR71_AMPCI